ncbi:MAG: hypothetical protein A4E40_01418 [Methanoregulaceae archaeon PtaU1.Bin059]|nr:MAG: hypothetical protein A4E40_01418 [Methanoregulaceae archaeon PtaU1.Bin059]
MELRELLIREACRDLAHGSELSLVLACEQERAEYMGPLPFTPLGPDDGKVQGVDGRLDLQPVLSADARGVGG